MNNFLEAIGECDNNMYETANRIINSGASYAEYNAEMKKLFNSEDTMWDCRMDGATGLRHFSDLNKVNLQGKLVAVAKLQNMSGINTCAVNNVRADFVLRTILSGYKDMPANVYRTDNISEYVVVFNKAVDSVDKAQKHLDRFCASTIDKANDFNLNNLKYKLTGRPETPRVAAGCIEKAGYTNTQKFITGLFEKSKDIFYLDDTPVRGAKKEKRKIRIKDKVIDDYFQKLHETHKKNNIQCDSKHMRNSDFIEICKKGGTIAAGDFVNMTGLNDRIAAIALRKDPKLFETRYEDYIKNKKLTQRDIETRNKIADYYIDASMDIIKNYAEQNHGRFYRDKGSDEVYVAFDNNSNARQFLKQSNKDVKDYYKKAGLHENVYSAKDSGYVPVTIILKGLKIKAGEFQLTGAVNMVDAAAEDAKNVYKNKHKRYCIENEWERRDIGRINEEMYSKAIQRLGCNKSLSR